MKKFKNMKLAQKMIAICIPILGVCLLLCLGALQVAFKIYDGKLYEKSLQELDFFTQQVNQNLDQVEDMSYNIAMDTKMQERLSEMKSLKKFTAEYSARYRELRMELDRQLMNSDMISSITYSDGYVTAVKVGVDTGSISREREAEILEGFAAEKGAYCLYPPVEDYPYLISGREIRKHIDFTLDDLGTLLFVCDVAGMVERHVDALEADSASLCILADTGVIYEGREGMAAEIPALSGDKGYQVIRADGVPYFLCYLKSSKTGWTYVNTFPYREIYGQNQLLRNLLIAGFLAIFLCSALVFRKLAHGILKPLEQLTESMQIVETGDFKGARSHLDGDVSSDEIGLLAQEFRVSLDKIDNLIHENYEKQILLQDTRYRMLQAQINPHFLYNTLNSINWMIRSQKNREAAEMTVALGDILRAALSRAQYFTIGEELAILKKYIRIQEYRYQRRAVFTVEEDGAAADCVIPHMTLQPLVENAISHCVDKMLTPCAIMVFVRMEKGRIFLTVSDDGPGMTAEELEAVRRFEVRTNGHGIGLKNIYERLHLAFGEEAVFVVESAPGEGTSIRIEIPACRDGELTERGGEIHV
ncbi:MAG: sensor histidine kinase [Eubacteriales bacterium]|nr:sensor histidine kinase [Eubacteriales bacterium]